MINSAGMMIPSQNEYCMGDMVVTPILSEIE